MLEIFDTPIIFSCFSFNFGKQFRVLKSQSEYEGKKVEEKAGIKAPHGAASPVSGTQICHYLGIHVFFHKKVFSPSTETFQTFSQFQYQNFLGRNFYYPIMKWQKYLAAQYHKAKKFDASPKFFPPPLYPALKMTAP